MNHLTRHVSFEITRRGCTTHFLSLEVRERERRENNKLSEVYSILWHMSNFRVKGQIAQKSFWSHWFLCHAQTHQTYPITHAAKRFWICLCPLLSVCVCKSNPLHLENDFSFDDLFSFWSVFCNIFFLYNKKPQTWLIMHACSAGCWHIALISVKTEREELIKCRASIVLLG